MKEEEEKEKVSKLEILGAQLSFDFSTNQPEAVSPITRGQIQERASEANTARSFDFDICGGFGTVGLVPLLSRGKPDMAFYKLYLVPFFNLDSHSSSAWRI